MKKRQKKKFVKRRHHRRREALRFHDGTAITVPAFLLPESAEIFRSEVEDVIRCIADCPQIETGGELFGFWKDDMTPVVAYAIGPGPNANYQVAFFNQDIDYLAATGGVLTAKYSLKHIREWHSHHRLGLPHPIGHDAATMAHGIHTAGRRSGAITAYTSPSDAAAFVQVGLSSDIAPINNLMVKLALVHLSRRTSGGIAALESELTYDYWMWVNRREPRFKNWDVVPKAGGVPTILRWYGAKIGRDEGCPHCGAGELELET